jgi:formylglycine-generating enzyme required for sulfatase activity
MRFAPLFAAALALAPIACAPAPPKACQANLAIPDPAHIRAGMVRIKGGTFLMGAAAIRPEEGPARPVTVGDFWIDQHEVTNAEFAKFVKATGYVTEAERPLDPKLYPGLSPSQMRPSSLVFVGAEPGVDRGDPSAWWRVIPGADWRHPKGPGSNIKGRETLPVVHIGYEDALAYARWLGRDLPTEAEWEYAARGGIAGAPYVWGQQKTPGGQPQANTWQGVFPSIDAGVDGYKASAAPVGCFKPNGYGLFDMAGNVWEWTKDQVAGGQHLIKGGSFLCADDYCFRYRPAAREVGPPDTGASHIGFRTVIRD